MNRVVNYQQSQKLFEEAVRYLPGGVNSPVRSCQAVGGGPVFVKKGRGARIWDEDGNEYLDYVGSWGPLIFGHCPALIKNAVLAALENGSSFGAPTAQETRLAKLISATMPSMEMTRLVNSGTEASMSAIRLARAFTGRERIIKFTGGYHGHADSLLVAAGSGVLTLGIPGSPGVPKALAELTLTLPYNNPEAPAAAFKAYPGQIAAVIVEPVAGNMGVVPGTPEFLSALAGLCREHGALFICDEVISGYRLGLGGAQGLFGLKPDLTILGKIIGGGLPLAAFGGRREIMERLAPMGDVYQAGTLSGNPLAVAAGIAAIEALRAEAGIYGRLNAMSETLAWGLVKSARQAGLAACGNQIGSMSTLFFTNGPVTDFASAQKSNPKIYGAFWRGMLERGIWLAPSQFETTFISAGHIPEDIDLTLEAAAEVFRILTA